MLPSCQRLGRKSFSYFSYSVVADQHSLSMLYKAFSYVCRDLGAPLTVVCLCVCVLKVQIRPWNLNDSDFVMDGSQPLDPRKTIFVGGVPRPLRAGKPPNPPAHIADR